MSHFRRGIFIYNVCPKGEKMKTLRKTLIVIPMLVFILACQALTRPLEQVKDTTGTAAAYATQAGEVVTQVSGLATEIAPFETLMPDPSAMPEIPGNIFDPQSPPLSEWNGIPIMPQASAGEESEGMYVFKIAATSQEIQDFYNAQLPNLGWETTVSLPMEGTAILLYSKGSQMLSVTIMPAESKETIVMITLQ
jgi:hypothetical protein